ncbi:MAG: peptidylprolyl isomerase [Acidobacteriaceae bacterium]
MIRILQQNNRFIKLLFALIIGAACITMVITLVPGIFDTTASGSDVYATIHGTGYFGRVFGDTTDIKTTEVQQVAQRLLQQQKLPDFLLPYMTSRAAQALVQRAILLREADKLGLQVSDADLRYELQHGAFAQVLFPDGKFIGDDAYTSFVQDNFNMSKADFETQVKHELEINRLQSLVSGGATVSDNEVRKYYLEQGTKVKFDYAVLTAEDLSKTINPTDAELQAFFKANAMRYANAIPEARKISYIAFDASNLPGGKPQVTDAEMEAYYNQHKDQYTVKDQVKVSHILIAVPAGASAAVDAAAKAKAEGILKQIRGGANFADLAKKYSDDPGSKAQGGELGYIQHGATVPEFDKTAFSLKPGQVSDVIKTQFGYHILKVEDRQTAHIKPFTEVKGEIEPLIVQQKVGQSEQNFAQQLATEAGKDGLAKTAAAHHLQVVTTDYLPQGSIIAGLPDGSAMLSKAFATTKGAAPQTASTGEGYAVFQVDDVKAAHAPDFAEYKAHILDDYRQQQLPQLLASKTSALADRAHVLNNLKQAAKEFGATVQTSDMVGRDAQVPDLGAMTGPGSVAFSLDKGQISKAINTGQNGIVLSVVDKQQPTPEEIAKNFDQTRDKLLSQRRDELFAVFVSDLTDKYEKGGSVRVNKKAQEALQAPAGGPAGS